MPSWRRLRFTRTRRLPSRRPTRSFLGLSSAQTSHWRRKKRRRKRENENGRRRKRKQRKRQSRRSSAGTQLFLRNIGRALRSLSAQLRGWRYTVTMKRTSMFPLLPGGRRGQPRRRPGRTAATTGMKGGPCTRMTVTSKPVESRTARILVQTADQKDQLCSSTASGVSSAMKVLL